MPANNPNNNDPVVPASTPEEVAADAGAMQQKQKIQRDEVRTNMLRSIVTEPLLSRVQTAMNSGKPDETFDIIISLNEMFSGGVPAAREQVMKRAAEWQIDMKLVRFSSHYVFAPLTAQRILDLANEARQLTAKSGSKGSVVYRIWEDSDINVTLTKSISTVKADAAQRSFQALGDGIVWAVLDSGIDGSHPHFNRDQTPFGQIATFALQEPVKHIDFTPVQNGALVDKFGHGSHVAGIIAGCWHANSVKGDPVAGTEQRNESDTSPNSKPILERSLLVSICGIAPACKLVSMKVVADVDAQGTTRQTAGQGKVSWILQAIDQIQEWNQNGKRLLIHGVNMSLGYDFDPRWFACGQSPICVEVNRLVKCGVSVVVSAGNSGYATFLTPKNSVARYTDISITDPGNADLAVTVGSTHRDMPHTYGVSYFSSRGPTGDGRMKPDLVAPGERIISCAAGLEVDKYGDDPVNGKVLYCEQTGTSMAAPHVSGAIAAFLSVRREFIGQPEVVKQLFLDNAIDLKRERKFQGAGLLDLMKVLQAI